MSCHTANMAYRALKLGLPISVVAEAGDVNPQTYPAWAKVALEFPERHGLPPVKFHWYEGHDHGKKVLPPEKLVKIMDEVRQKHNIKDSGSGSIMVGEKGMLFSPDDYGARYFLLPEDKFADYKKPDADLAAQRRRRQRHEEGMGGGHPRRPAGVLQLRHRKSSHRVDAARQRGDARHRQEVGIQRQGRQDHQQ